MAQGHEWYHLSILQELLEDPFLTGDKVSRNFWINDKVLKF